MIWNIYILKYKRTGNYYVGTAPDWKTRIKDHSRKKSPKKLNSRPSQFNKSTEGFFYFIYEITGFRIDNNELGRVQNISNVEQSISCIFENALTEYLRNQVKEGIIVNGGCFTASDKEEKRILGTVNENKFFSLSESERLFFEEKLPNIFKFKIDSMTDTDIAKVIGEEEVRLKLINSGEL